MVGSGAIHDYYRGFIERRAPKRASCVPEFMRNENCFLEFFEISRHIRLQHGLLDVKRHMKQIAIMISHIIQRVRPVFGKRDNKIFRLECMLLQEPFNGLYRTIPIVLYAREPFLGRRIKNPPVVHKSSAAVMMHAYS